VVLFLISALMSTLGPGAVPLLASTGAKFIVRYKLRPVLIGLILVHGAQAGAFSPATPYGVIVSCLMKRFDLQPQPWLLYACVLTFNTLLGYRVFCWDDRVFIADTVGRVGSPLLAVLLTCYIAAALSSAASSLGVIGSSSRWSFGSCRAATSASSGPLQRW
jgi:hypothetical protein